MNVTISGSCDAPGGYFFDTYDWYPAMYDNENGNALKDTGMEKYEEWCDRYARRLGLETRAVEAPAALKVHGIMTLKAFLRRCWRSDARRCRKEG